MRIDVAVSLRDCWLFEVSLGVKLHTIYPRANEVTGKSEKSGTILDGISDCWLEPSYLITSLDNYLPAFAKQMSEQW